MDPLLSLPRRDYAAIVFFANNRFETGKKKLQYLSFGDFAFCAELMIQNWTLGAVGEAPTDPGAGPRSQQPFFFRAPAQPLLLTAQRPPTQLVCPACSFVLWGAMKWEGGLRLSQEAFLNLPPQFPSWASLRLPGG